ncbi:MAG: hypothetical protein JSU85_00765 [Candidatus Zixiibacteriota bacterium]|nr:MAG: hypothetical protein JSU85_00765 [candidate division Zixibacteria bacterium]
MISNDRISRKQRLKTLKNKKAGIALVLALILISLVVGKTYRTQLGILLESSSIKNVFQKNSPDELDSLVIQTGRGFRLNNPTEVDTAFQDTTGIRRMRFLQPWPSGLPLEFYARKLQELTGKSGINCNCVMFGRDDSLVCELISGDNGRAKIVAIPDKKTGLEERFLGIILKNIYELENQEINSIVKSRIPFGYLAEVDVFPAGEIKTQLRSEWVTSILTIPASRKDLVKYDLLKEKGESEYRDLAMDLLNRHPNIAFLRFERSEDTDYLFVEALFDRAKGKKIGYIYENSAPDRIDSLAFSAGLTFISYAKILDYTDKNLNEIQTALIRELIYLEDPCKTIITVDISKMQSQKMISLMLYLNKIGINGLNINKLTDYPEFMIEDL